MQTTFIVWLAVMIGMCVRVNVGVQMIRDSSF